MNAAEFKSIRIKAGLTQTALATLLGLSRAMIAKYEATPPPHHPIPLLVERFMRELEKDTP